MNTQPKKKRHDSSVDSMEHIFSMVAEQFHRYWRVIVIALAAVIIALWAFQNYTGRKSLETEQTRTALAQMEMHQMSSEDQLREIVEKCQRLLTERWVTEATPWVLLQLGAAYMKLGEPEHAVGIYERILDEYNRHYVSSIALPNLAAAMELKGNYAQAADIFNRAAENNSPEKPNFLIAAGRNMEMAGERDAAIALYQDAIEKARDLNINIGRLELAEYRLSALRRGGELMTGPPEPPPPPEEPEAGAPDIAPMPAPTPETPQEEDTPEPPGELPLPE